MGTSLLSGPKYHIIRTPAAPTGKAQDGETAVLVYSFSVSLPGLTLNLFAFSFLQSFFILSFFLSVAILFVYLFRLLAVYLVTISVTLIVYSKIVG
jgi:hypothetical protein